MKNRVLNWIENGCDFNTGILLLADSGRHRQLIKVIANRPHRYASKLLYELCKEAGIPYRNLGHADFSVNSGHADLSGNSGQADLSETSQHNAETNSTTLSTDSDKAVILTDGQTTGLKTLSDEEFKQLPVNVQTVIREHSKLFMLRSRLHEQMVNMPEDNKPGTVKHRKNLSDSIALLSPRIDLLFQAKEDFYKKNLMPDMAVLFPPVSPDAEPSSKEKPLPDSVNELKKLKKNLQSANVKDQNLLDYQDEKKAGSPAPMPVGPKRLKMEQRIQERLNQIEAINYKLLTKN